MSTRARQLRLPIDPERPTRWAFVEFIYCLGRDARRGWRRARQRRFTQNVWFGAAVLLLSIAGTAVNQHFNIGAAMLRVLIER
jgi:hypothetical protein